MCRLTAYVGPPISLSPMVFGGTHPLAQQSWAPRELLSGSVNVDGYGITWWTGEGSRPMRLTRSEPIWHDPDLPGLLGGLAGGPVVAALRNTTPGLPVDRSGVPPFARDRWVFVLNGYVPAFRGRHMRALRTHLPDAFYARLEGVSDAETLFHLALAAMSRGASPPDALREVRGRVAERLAPSETSPLTMIMASRDGLWGMHTTLNGRVNSLYTIAGSGLAPRGRLLASEALTDEDGWNRIPDHTVLHISGEGELEMEPVE